MPSDSGIIEGSGEEPAASSREDVMIGRRGFRRVSLVVLLLATGVPMACDSDKGKPGPMEKAGRKADQAVDKAAQQIEKTAEETRKTLEAAKQKAVETGEAVSEKARQAGDDVAREAKKAGATAKEAAEKVRTDVEKGLSKK